MIQKWQAALSQHLQDQQVMGRCDNSISTVYPTLNVKSLSLIWNKLGERLRACTDKMDDVLNMRNYKTQFNM